MFFLITIGHQPEYLVRAAVEAAAAEEGRETASSGSNCLNHKLWQPKNTNK